jgi:hypothetical protein
VVVIDISNIVPKTTCCNSPKLYTQYKYRLFTWALSIARNQLLEGVSLRKLGYTEESKNKIKGFTYLKFLIVYLLEIKYKQLNQSFCTTEELPYTEFIKDSEVDKIINFFFCFGIDVSCAFSIMKIKVNNNCCSETELDINCPCEDIVPTQLERQIVVFDVYTGDRTETVEGEVAFKCCNGSNELSVISVTTPVAMTGITFTGIPSATTDSSYAIDIAFVAETATLGNYLTVVSFEVCDTTFTKEILIQVVNSCVPILPNDFPIASEELDVSTNDGDIININLSAEFTCCGDNTIEYLGTQTAIPTQLGISLLNLVVGEISIDNFPTPSFQFNRDGAVVGYQSTIYLLFRLCGTKIVKAPIKFNIVDSCIVGIPEPTTVAVSINTNEILETETRIFSETITVPLEYQCCDTANNSWRITNISYGGFDANTLFQQFGITILNPSLGLIGTGDFTFTYTYNANIAPTRGGVIAVQFTLEFCNRPLITTTGPVFSIVPCTAILPLIPVTTNINLFSDTSTSIISSLDFGEFHCCVGDYSYGGFTVVDAITLNVVNPNSYGITINTTGLNTLVSGVGSVTYDYSILTSTNGSIVVQHSFTICGNVITVPQTIVITDPIYPCGTIHTLVVPTQESTNANTSIGWLRVHDTGTTVTTGKIVVAYQAFFANPGAANFSIHADINESNGLVNVLKQGSVDTGVGTIVMGTAPQLLASTNRINSTVNADRYDSVSIHQGFSLTGTPSDLGKNKCIATEFTTSATISTENAGNNGFSDRRVNSSGILSADRALLPLGNNGRISILVEAVASTPRFYYMLLCVDENGYPISDSTIADAPIRHVEIGDSRVQLAVSGGNAFAYITTVVYEVAANTEQLQFDFIIPNGAAPYHVSASSVSNVEGGYFTSGNMGGTSDAFGFLSFPIGGTPDPTAPLTRSRILNAGNSAYEAATYDKNNAISNSSVLSIKVNTNNLATGVGDRVVIIVTSLSFSGPDTITGTSWELDNFVEV